MRGAQVHAGRCKSGTYVFVLPPPSGRQRRRPRRRDITDRDCAEALARIFDRPDGKQFDYVFNCGGETRYSQEDEVYKLRSLALSLAVAKEAAKRGVKAFVELSTGMVYKSDSAPSKEQDKLKPWNKIAVYKLQAEEELAKVEG